VRPKFAAFLLAGALVLTAACGGDDDDTEASGATDTTAADAGAPAGEGAAAASTGTTDLGEVLVNADGMTLYAFTSDSAGTSTCTGDCAATWPPASLESAELPAGLDPAVFSVATNDDGSFQLAAGNQPLYTFSGDAAPGDTNGQGIEGAWFVVGADGQMIQDAGGAGAGGGEAETTTTSPPTTAEDTGGGYDY
jgi:predicted lipoprotein with Yx(FWY)xxD motif